MRHARVQRDVGIELAIITGGIALFHHWIIASFFSAWTVKCLWQTMMGRRMAAAIRFVQTGS
jgi:hypothetical protein